MKYCMSIVSRYGLVEKFSHRYVVRGLLKGLPGRWKSAQERGAS